MFRKYTSIALLLAIVGISSGLGSGYYDCPDDKKAVHNVGHVDKDVPASIFGFVTLDIRIPETGLLNEPITCTIVTDLSSDGGSGTVSQVGGGLGSKYVELKITSKFLRGLKYRVDVYTDAATTTSGPKTTEN
nr:uncharacterized protein LOC111507202 [Leptinotarsa decemlineata]